METDLFAVVPKDEVLSAASYAEFKEALKTSNCTKCALSASRTQIVVDRGNPEAKVMMIGEAPGENEDLQGKAFCGRSGKLLDSMLQELGFNTDEESIIVNVAKCRPPENRAPKQPEVDACKPYLKKQISLVSPGIILLLGATALKHMWKGKKTFSMQDEAGRWFNHPEYPGVQFMVLYHPAYILRDPRKTSVMTEHLKRFKIAYDRLV